MSPNAGSGCRNFPRVCTWRNGRRYPLTGGIHGRNRGVHQTKPEPEFCKLVPGQKVGSLIGLLTAAGIGLLGWAGIAIAQPAIHSYWPPALAMAFLSLVLIVTPYRMWRLERGRVIAAENRLVPKIKCTFDKSPGCQHQTKLKVRHPQTMEAVSSIKIRLFRVRVETQGRPGGVKDCRANLLWLKRDNRLLFDHEALPLTIAPSEREEPFSKDIRDKVPEYIDLFCITEKNNVSIYPPHRPFPISIQPFTLFSGPGEYLFHVVVSAEDSSSSEIDVVLNWTGDWHTAQACAKA